MNKAVIHVNDALELLKTMDSSSIQCCVTSPPYWGLRDYGIDGQLGHEKTPEEYVSKMVDVFREVRRVLRDDGTLWLNIGDSYAGNCSRASDGGRAGFGNPREGIFKREGDGLKPKDLVGIPWMVAFALRADGWYLRQDIIWHKPNAMPESVTDRCTKAHEYIFMFASSSRYKYNSDAIKEDAVNGDPSSPRGSKGVLGQSNFGLRDKQSELGKRTYTGFNHRRKNQEEQIEKRNKRSVWTVNTVGSPEAHFATFPPKLVEPCILAGSDKGDTILDPFSGRGTTGVVALAKERDYIGIELNPEYAEMSLQRIRGHNPLFNNAEIKV